mmetsp:Transcript_13465/g.26444  ORF Transcript_13465/g.26444 Transcript_13465/m.26444 type:complete len:201 (+) Transcript_13465:442-1044(+)
MTSLSFFSFLPSFCGMVLCPPPMYARQISRKNRECPVQMMVSSSQYRNVCMMSVILSDISDFVSRSGSHQCENVSLRSISTLVSFFTSSGVRSLSSSALAFASSVRHEAIRTGIFSPVSLPRASQPILFFTSLSCRCSLTPLSVSVLWPSRPIKQVWSALVRGDDNTLSAFTNFSISSSVGVGPSSGLSLFFSFQRLLRS